MRHLTVHDVVMPVLTAFIFIVNLVLGAEGRVANIVAAGIAGFGLAVMLFFVGRTIEMRDQTEYLRSLRNLR